MPKRSKAFAMKFYSGYCWVLEWDTTFIFFFCLSVYSSLSRQWTYTPFVQRKATLLKSPKDTCHVCLA